MFDHCPGVALVSSGYKHPETSVQLRPCVQCSPHAYANINFVSEALVVCFGGVGLATLLYSTTLLLSVPCPSSILLLANEYHRLFHSTGPVSYLGQLPIQHIAIANGPVRRNATQARLKPAPWDTTASPAPTTTTFIHTRKNGRPRRRPARCGLQAAGLGLQHHRQ